MEGLVLVPCYEFAAVAVVVDDDDTQHCRSLLGYHPIYIYKNLVGTDIYNGMNSVQR